MIGPASFQSFLQSLFLPFPNLWRMYYTLNYLWFPELMRLPPSTPPYAWHAFHFLLCLAYTLEDTLQRSPPLLRFPYSLPIDLVSPSPVLSLKKHLSNYAVIVCLLVSLFSVQVPRGQRLWLFVFVYPQHLSQNQAHCRFHCHCCTCGNWLVPKAWGQRDWALDFRDSLAFFPTSHRLDSLFGWSRPEIDASRSAGSKGRTRPPGAMVGMEKLNQGHLGVGVEVEWMNITGMTRDSLIPTWWSKNLSSGNVPHCANTPKFGSHFP